MPTFAAITLDRLLEPGSRNPPPKPPPALVRLERASSDKTSVSRLQASPALYVTPEATPPLPDSPSSFPPSPYVVNHKRRGPRLFKSLSQSIASDVEPLHLNDSQKTEISSKSLTRGSTNVSSVRETQVVEYLQNGSGLMMHVNGGNGDKTENLSIPDAEKDGENEVFFDLQDTMSSASNAEVDENGGLERSVKPSTPIGEYQDAFEEVPNEVSVSPYRNMETMMREMRLNLLMEIERRRHVEEAYKKLQNQWLQHLRMELPDHPPPIDDETSEVPSVDPANEFCRQLIVSRVVAAAFERGYCRAELELEMEPEIESMKFEIARLKDRLQYYEATNREMSQRNQETVEIARQERLKRKRRRKWLWGAVGLAITFGVSSLAWSYFPTAASRASSKEQSSEVDHE